MAIQSVEVIVNLKTRALDKLFTYRIAEEHLADIAVGDRVVVPFANSFCDALVWQLNETEPQIKLKEIAYLLPKKNALSRSQLCLIALLRKHYLATYQEAFLTVLSSVQKLDKIISYNVNRSFANFKEGQVVSAETLLQAVGKNKIPTLIKEKILSQEVSFDFKISSRKTEYVLRLFTDSELALAKLSKRAVKRQRIVKYLAEREKVSYSSLCAATRATRRDILAMAELGFLKLAEADIAFDHYKYSLSPKSVKQPDLTSEQRRVLDAYHDLSTPRAALLHGVTGSGKTRIYIEIAKEMIARGKQVLLLVPEISLTPQLIERFSSQLNAKIGVVHSQVAQSDKLKIYQDLKSGELDVIIGARSALFCSFKDLGAIIIDEEHEQSFASQNIPRYHAVDLALALAKKMQIDIVLGSATPAAETYQMAETGKLSYFKLSKAIAKQGLANIEIVDIRGLDFRDSCLSIQLHRAMVETFAQNQQVILFHNRRGFAHYRQCHHCAHIEICDNCSVPLTVHASGKILNCHYCDYQRSVSEYCPVCGETLSDKGVGIDLLLMQLQSLFPDKRFALLQAQQTRSIANFRQILDAFGRGEIDCLLGTQVLAKGLDFPNVTLVGVLLADQLLAKPDFRGLERAYQILLQVAGRAGRSTKAGRVIVQTLQTEHDLFNHLIDRDYEQFIDEQLKQRQLLEFPPFAEHLSLNISSENAVAAKEQAEKIYQFYSYNYQKNAVQAQIYPPQEQYYFKIRNRYFYSIFIKSQMQAKQVVYKTLNLGIINNKYKLIRPDCWVDINFER